MARKKKIKEEVNLADLEPKLSHSFCEKCKNSDVRLIKDTLNMIVPVVNDVANELGVEATTFRSRCIKLKEWVRDKRRMREEIYAKRRKKNKET